MEELQYIGETLWPGIVGHLAVITAFISALAGAYAYYRNMRSDDESWRPLARTFFTVHGISVFVIIGTILCMMINQMFEYVYVWEHVSEDLPMKYIFSAFWEGQEGSFLLWMFWHVILGFILMRTAGKWESPVLAVLLSIEVIIASMILGIHFTDTIKIGSSPFMLLRETMQAPIFARADYLSMIEGNGLNPLLQNYWMTIHPPTLFLGFASVSVPFCFAIGGLLTGNHREWLKPVMPWALFSGGILGTGILMGGAWAYEALSFGGYWAWDPVENMSLVPWIILVAGVHSNLIAQRTGYSIRTAYMFYCLSFILILYSTFLTRSGILGDSSAHAFTQMGLEWQLVALVGGYTLLSLFLLGKNWKKIPVPEKEERIQSREFWMFIGTLVLLFSAVLISFTTSIPVFNKLISVFGDIIGQDMTDLHRTAPVDPEAHYNKFQLWIAVFIAILSSIAQYLRYKEPNWKSFRVKFVRHLAIAVLLGAAGTLFAGQFIRANAWQYWVVMASAVFAIAANLDYLITTARLQTKLAASVLSHLGFSVMIIGVLASGLNKEVISTNPFAQMGLVEDLDDGEHITLIRDRPMFMNGYWVEYEQDTLMGNIRQFLVSYKKINADQDTIERFSLTPNVVFNNKQTKVAATNPSTKHYLNKDIFTYVAALPNEQMDVEEAQKINDTLNYVQHDLVAGDSLVTQDFRLYLTSVSTNPMTEEYTMAAGDLPVQAMLSVFDIRGDEWYEVNALVYLREGLVYGFPAQINDLNMRIRLSDDAIRQFYVPEDSIDYTPFQLKQGASTQVGNWTITLQSIERDAQHVQYAPQEGDIAVNAVLTLTGPDGEYTARPLYYIRDSRPSNVKDVLPDAGLHVRFDHIDPTTETFSFRVAQNAHGSPVVPLMVATNVPRNDLIVLAAIVFPGINLFWSGAILMMVGLFLAMWNKRRKRTA